MTQTLLDHLVISLRRVIPHKVEGRSFSHRRIVIDNGSWKGCTFSDCDLVYYGGSQVTLEGNRFIGFHLTLRGKAAGGVHVVSSFAKDFPPRARTRFLKDTLGITPEDLVPTQPPGFSVPALVKNEDSAA